MNSVLIFRVPEIEILMIICKGYLMMAKWRELSIDKRFITVSIIQTSSIIAFSFFIEDDNVFVIVPFILVFYLYVLNTKFKEYKKSFFVYSICISLFWIHTYSWYLTKDFSVSYNGLKNYSGINWKNTKSSVGQLILNKDGIKSSFDCSITSYGSCYKEIKQHFNIKNLYGHSISVKYHEFSSYDVLMWIIPFHYRNPKNIYEIKHNGDILYSYDYFINKYSRQQRNLRIFAIYLIVNSLVFCIFYHWIQKDFVKHSQ